MCAFEEEIKKKFKQKKNVIKVIFTGRWIVICAIHRWIVLFRQIEWNYSFNWNKNLDLKFRLHDAFLG
jgi:hypothetical protein